jgi:heme o synthase
MLGAVFVTLAWRLWRSSTPARASALFHYSLLYLALLFAVVALDAVVG